MFGPARYLADFAGFVATRAPQERADAQLLRDLEAAAPRVPAALELEWLGTATT